MISQLIQSMGSELSQLGIELIEKPWESKLLRRNVVALVWSTQREGMFEAQREESWTQALRKLQLKLEVFRPCLLTTRVLALNLEATRALENSGFHLMECYLELDHSLKRIPSTTAKSVIRPFRKDDVPKLERIAFESFQYSRFHMDPQFTSTEANKSRAEWVRNSCMGDAKAVFVAEVDQRPVGFVICKEETSSLGTVGNLDLIGVHPDYRKRKLGYNLTVEFLKFCRSQRYCLAKVGTQAHNIPSLRMYEKTGFVMRQAYYSYHKHII